MPHSGRLGDPGAGVRRYHARPLVAKKSRTPAPPRPVQSPRRRTTAPATGPAADRQRLMLYAIAVSGLVALGIVIAVILLTRGGGANVAAAEKAVEAAGGTFKTYPEQSRRHVSLNYKFKYNSFPPTSGPHYFQWVLWGMYDQPVRQKQAIHNLEHGGMVIQYGSKVPLATVRKIGDFYRSDPNAMLVAPLPALGNKIALEAWTHLATLTHFNENAFKKFRDALRYHGPEHYPKSVLQPGQ
jgi:uncharacterized protein DUF3105